MPRFHLWAFKTVLKVPEEEPKPDGEKTVDMISPNTKRE